MSNMFYKFSTRHKIKRLTDKIQNHAYFLFDSLNTNLRVKGEFFEHYRLRSCKS